MSHSKIMLASLALVVFLIALPHLSHGLILNGQNIAQVKIPGVVYCSVAGNANPDCGGVNCPPLNGALVTVSCNGGTTTLGQAVTNTAGAYEVVFNTLDSLLFDPSACYIFVRARAASCAVLPPTGLLRATLAVGSVVSGLVSGLTGGIATLVPGVFQLI